MPKNRFLFECSELILVFLQALAMEGIFIANKIKSQILFSACMQEALKLFYLPFP